MLWVNPRRCVPAVARLLQVRWSRCVSLTKQHSATVLSVVVWHPAGTEFLWGKEMENSSGGRMAEKWWHSHTAPGKWSHRICIPVSYPEGCSRFCLNVHQEENELQVSISPRENLFPETLQLMKWGSINSSIITMRALALCPALPLTLFTLITSGLPLHSSIGWSILGQLKCDVHLSHGVYLLTGTLKRRAQSRVLPFPAHTLHRIPDCLTGGQSCSGTPPRYQDVRRDKTKAITHLKRSPMKSLNEPH